MGHAENVLGLIAIPIQIGLISARSFAQTIRHYDELARHGRTAEIVNQNVEFARGGRERLLSLSQNAVAQGSDSEIVGLWSITSRMPTILRWRASAHTSWPDSGINLVGRCSRLVCARRAPAFWICNGA